MHFPTPKPAALTLLAFALTACTAAPSAKRTALTNPAAGSPPTTQPASLPGAELCYQKLLAIVHATQHDLPALSASAQGAAQLVVTENQPIGAAGDPALVAEMCGRCGGLMSLQNLRIPPQKPWQGVVLYALRNGPRMADEDAFFIHYYRSLGCHVVLFGSQRLLNAVHAKDIDTADAIPNHAPDSGGIITLHGRALVPLDQTANIAAMWTWTAEFVAACTRLGKMPTMYQGYAFPGGRQRDAALGNARFHAGQPIPVAPLALGNAYLDALRQTMQTFHQREMHNLQRAATQAIAARDAHHGVYTYVESHVMIWQLDEPHDPNLFTKAGWWKTLRPDIQLSPGDFFLALCYADLFDNQDWNFFAQKARAAHVQIAWALGGFNPPPPTVPSNEIFINQIWKPGDAIVTVPGYDIKILPASGFMQELIYQSTCAEILTRRPDQWQPKK